jgi:phospholipid-translocating ATPase
LSKTGKVYWETTKTHLAKYGDAGLRTLALAYRVLEEAEYAEWNDVFHTAKTTIGHDRDALLDAASDLIEKELTLVGATAVEDKLQIGVGVFFFCFVFFFGGGTKYVETSIFLV